jgi:hypothetical protein
MAMKYRAKGALSPHLRFAASGIIAFLWRWLHGLTWRRGALRTGALLSLGGDSNANSS